MGKRVRLSIPPANVFSAVCEDLRGRVAYGRPERQISQSPESLVCCVKFISL